MSANYASNINSHIYHARLENDVPGNVYQVKMTLGFRKAAMAEAVAENIRQNQKTLIQDAGGIRFANIAITTAPVSETSGAELSITAEIPENLFGARTKIQTIEIKTDMANIIARNALLLTEYTRFQPVSPGPVAVILLPQFRERLLKTLLFPDPKPYDGPDRQQPGITIEPLKARSTVAAVGRSI